MEQIITDRNVNAAADAIRRIVPGFEPEIAIVLGSGMGEMAEAIEKVAEIPYEDIPFMVPTTVHIHKGCLILGTLEGKNVICMQGRLHAYEGNSAQQIAFPVYVMKMLGAQALIVTNAAGGIDPSFEVGDIMLIEDHINFQMMNPCLGAEHSMGPRFFDMTHPYALDLVALAEDAARECDVKVHKGVYIGDLGPSFETPAEIRAFRMMGADAVGMSTVQEVIAANQIGLKVLGISMISNPAAGVCAEPLDISDVLKAAHVAAANIGQLIRAMLRKL